MFPVGGVIQLSSLPGASRALKLDWMGEGTYAAKCYTAEKPFTLVAETVCAELALFLNLPIPAYRAVPFQGKTWFGMEWRAENRMLEPRMIGNLVNTDTVPGIFAFDVLTCNWDRNDSNLVVQKASPALERYKLWMIDHSHALGGDLPTPNDFLGRDKSPMQYLRYWENLRGLVIKWEQFQPFLKRVKALGSTQLTAMIRAVPTEWRPPGANLSYLSDFLLSRAGCLEDLLWEARGEFPNLGGERS
jgi:hypothetical protein